MKVKIIGHTIFLLLGIISSFIIVAPGHTANKFKLKPGAKGRVCVKCHEDFQKILKSRFVHPLLKKGECTGCHVPHTSTHKNLLTIDRTKLCYGCHQKVLPEKAQSAHQVVVEANCQKCHNSHGSNNKFILTKAGNGLCFDCHEEMGNNLKKVEFKHKSLEKGKGCLNCHDPHASAKSNFLLKAEAPSLCKRCHETNKLTFVRKHMNYPVANTNCNSCHDPHGSNKRGIIFDVAHTAVTERTCEECHQKATSLKTKKPASELCKDCHRDMVQRTFNKNRLHWPVVDKVGCLNCHDPHASREQKLVKGSLSNVCGKCHSDTVERQESSRNNPDNKRLCEPVKQGNCTSCHSPHSSNNLLLFDQASIDADLCGRCHQWQTHSTHPIGEKVIDQRNKNLTVGCLSCHLGCGTGNKPNMLPFNSTYELCIQCHVERRR